jgi:4-amino-4-deoxy-L-arabinose transferase-like glycosyltransferase
VYAVAIATLWAWISAPRTRRTWLLAAVTAVAFLMRHDHGIYVAATFGILLLFMWDRPWRERVRHGVVYGLATLLLLAPYLVFLQVNGGVDRHIAMAYGWTARDFDRAPTTLDDKNH